MIRHEDQNIAVLDQFGRQAPGYASLGHASDDPRFAPLVSLADPRASDRLLDVACGTGRLALALAPLVDEVVGIDLTEAMIDEARAAQGAADVRWIVGDVLPLPFDAGRFSLLVCSAAFHHMADPAAVLAEMARVCTAAGRIAVIDLTPDPDTAEAFNRFERLRDPSHVRAMTPDALRALGPPLGLREIGVRSISTRRFTLEAIMSTSFPADGDADRVRALAHDDAAAGHDQLGLDAALEAGVPTIRYPMTIVVWARDARS